MENTGQVQRLYTKFLNNECSIEEIDFLLEYFKTSSEAELLALIHSELMVDEDDASAISDAETEKLGEIFQRLKLTTHPKKTIPLYRRKIFAYLAAACIALIVGTVAILLNLVQDPNVKDSVSLSLSKGNISPGKNTAVLILANGEVIKLSDAKTGVVIDATKLTYNDGTEVRDPAINARHPDAGQDPALAMNTKLVTASTPRGGTYQIILPDGTHIWLNASSTLKFPATFAKLKERKVELTGEAYFVVKHNAKQPFRVQTTSQIVEDIGTEFNINSYADEPATKTTLIEGSARIISTSRHPEFSSGPQNRKENSYGLNSKAGILKQVQDDVVLKPGQQDDVVLKPGQQSELINGSIQIKEIEVSDAVAWKNGYFMFSSETMESAMNKIARWYDVSIKYDDQSLKSETLFGSISKYENVSKVLRMLESTKVFSFEVSGRTIMVSRNKSQN